MLAPNNIFLRRQLAQNVSLDSGYPEKERSRTRVWRERKGPGQVIGMYLAGVSTRVSHECHICHAEVAVQSPLAKLFNE